jgi:shikimate dehydrogenase
MSVLKVALLGKELSHSVSPQLHHELYKILGRKFSLDSGTCIYDLVECAEECDLAQWIKTAPTNGYLGANVTYPYKGNGFSLSDRHIGSVSFIDSANCLRFFNSEIYGASTDGEGLVYSVLREYPTFDLSRYHLVLIGAGNAARAAVYALCTRWMPKSLTIVNRSIAGGEELAEFCIAQAPGPTVRVMGVSDFIHSAPELRHRFILQCTPVGQINHPGDSIPEFVWHETDFALDLIYNPLRTSFLKTASHSGAKTLNGLGMLIEQAALSQVFWLTGLMPDASPLSETDYDSMKEALTKILPA